MKHLKASQAARFSGINTRMVIAGSYVIAGLLTGVSDIMPAFYTNSVFLSGHGNSQQLYAIAAALLQVVQNPVNLRGVMADQLLQRRVAAKLGVR